MLHKESMVASRHQAHYFSYEHQINYDVLPQLENTWKTKHLSASVPSYSPIMAHTCTINWSKTTFRTLHLPIHWNRGTKGVREWVKHGQQKFVSERETENVSGHEEEEAKVEAVDKQVGKKRTKSKLSGTVPQAVAIKLSSNSTAKRWAINPATVLSGSPK